MDFTTYEPRISALEAGGGDFFIINQNQGALDKTWQEITDAVEEKPGYVLIYGARGQYPVVVTSTAMLGGSYSVRIAYRMTATVEQQTWYYASGPDEYPIVD